MLKIKVICALMLVSLYCVADGLPVQEPITPQEAAIIDEIIVKLRQLKNQNEDHGQDEFVNLKPNFVFTRQEENPVRVHRTLDTLGGGYLLKRNLDSLGGGYLLKKRGDQRGSIMDPLGGGYLL